MQSGRNAVCQSLCLGPLPDSQGIFPHYTWPFQSFFPTRKNAKEEKWPLRLRLLGRTSENWPFCSPHTNKPSPSYTPVLFEEMMNDFFIPRRNQDVWFFSPGHNFRQIFPVVENGLASLLGIRKKIWPYFFLLPLVDPRLYVPPRLSVKSSIH